MVPETPIRQFNPHRVDGVETLDQVVCWLELLRRHPVGSVLVRRILMLGSGEAKVGLVLQLPRQQPGGVATGHDYALYAFQVLPHTW